MSECLPVQKCTKCGDMKDLSNFNVRKERGVHYRQCRSCMASRKWYLKNREKHNENYHKWVAANRDKARMIWRSYRKESARENPSIRMHWRVSCQIRGVLNKSKNYTGVFDVLGYTKESLVSHIERQFVGGMGWNNVSEWHIDHITPIASFGITEWTVDDIRRVWALSNLRPIWAMDNLKKGAKMEFLL